MATDLSLLGDKLRRYREQFGLAVGDVADATGIDVESIRAFESGLRQPSGDQILIFADYFKCDYKFFVSNEKLAPIDQTEALFRRHGDEFSPKDRWALQEVLFLAECESFLQQRLGKPLLQFSFVKQGRYFKAHGEAAAAKLRDLLGFSATEISSDVFGDFRKLGIHMFRRKLENSNISGLYVKHPAAGPTVLINYGEDVYRQRFTAAHEAGHSLLDAEQEFVVSLERSQELYEVRANAFASHFLLPRSVFSHLVDPRISDDEFVKWSNKLKVNPESLSIALLDAKKISSGAQQHYRGLKIPRSEKLDVELTSTLSAGTRERKAQLLERGALGLLRKTLHRRIRQWRGFVRTPGRDAALLQRVRSGRDSDAVWAQVRVCLLIYRSLRSRASRTPVRFGTSSRRTLSMARPERRVGCFAAPNSWSMSV